MLFLPILYFLLFSATIQQALFASNQPQYNKKQINNQSGSSIIFPLTGNVYPKGYYQATLRIGNPAKPYFLDIDSGSDLTWLQCDAPCTKCIPAPHPPYKPKKELVTCKDPICSSLQLPESLPCESPDEQCDYVVTYADHGSSMGVLVKDLFPLKLTNGSILGPALAFGCGYNQEVADSGRPPYTDGVLGLGNGKSSIVAQIHNLGLTRNVVGHCLSGKGGGFLFLGEDIVPSSGIVWMPISSKCIENHYCLGSAELHFGSKATGVKDLAIVFDSGSTYTYFDSQAYDIVLSLIQKNINEKQLQEADDNSLPVCWKGTKPFKSIRDVNNLFNPLALSFSKPKKAQLQLSPEAYLIVTDKGNVCLGILNGSEVGLDNFNIIGDISLQDKMVIYDNEKRQIGWAPANCDRLPKYVDREEDEYITLYGADAGILQGY